MSWQHVFLELSEDGKCGCNRASTPWEGTPAFSGRATCPFECQIFPSPSVSGQQHHGGPVRTAGIYDCYGKCDLFMYLAVLGG